MGTVYKVVHTGFDELRALKVINPELMTDAMFLKRFKQEAFITRKLQHPNAVRVDDIDEAEDGRPFMVMEYIEGQSLKNLMKDQGQLPAPRVCSIAKQVAAALDAAHRLGMVHRDIKPENIVLIQTPEGEQAKVLDFGIAKVKEGGLADDAKAMTLTGVGVVVGTPQYMSPEQANGQRGSDLDGRADLYSLGVVMYEMLTGNLPFKASTTIEMLLAHMQKPPRPIFMTRPNVQVPYALADLVMRTLQKRRELRPANAATMIEEIERAEMGFPPGAPRIATKYTAASAAKPPATIPPHAPTVALKVDRPATGYGAARAVGIPPAVVHKPSHGVRWSLMLLFAALAGSAAWYFLTNRPGGVVEQHRAAGAQFEAQKLYPQAEDEYRAAVQIDPKNAALQSALANVLIEEKKWDEGIGAFHEVLKLRPDDPVTHNNLGVALQTAGNLPEAISEYREALSLQANYVDAHLNLGHAQEKLGDLNGAIAEYREALHIKPDDADVHYHIGLAYYKLGNSDAAVSEYREAIRLKPGFALAHYGLGGVLYNRGEHEAGIEELRTAYSLAPDDPEIRAFYEKLLLR